MNPHSEPLRLDDGERRTLPVAEVPAPCEQRPVRPSFQVTRAGDYAIRALVHLALDPKACVSQAAVARETFVPLAFLGKVLQQLAAHRFVDSIRGQRGGYRITERGRTASMLDVVEAIDGPISMNVCVADPVRCPRSAWCPAHLVWREAELQFVSVLSAATIAGLAVSERERRALFGPIPGRSPR